MKRSGLLVDEALMVLLAFFVRAHVLSISDVQNTEEKDELYFHREACGYKKVEVASVDRDPPSTSLQALITWRLEEHGKKIKFSRNKWHTAS